MKKLPKIPFSIKFWSIILGGYILVHKEVIFNLHNTINNSFESSYALGMNLLVKIIAILIILLGWFSIIQWMNKVISMLFDTILFLLKKDLNSNGSQSTNLWKFFKWMIKEIDYKWLGILMVWIYVLSFYFSEKQSVILMCIWIWAYNYIQYIKKSSVTKEEVEDLIKEKLTKS